MPVPFLADKRAEGMMFRKDSVAMKIGACAFSYYIYDSLLKRKYYEIHMS